MTRFTSFLGMTAIVFMTASALFAWRHPTDVVVLSVMANLALLVFGWVLFAVVRPLKAEATDRSSKADRLLVRLSFVSLVILVNVMLRHEMSRATILADPLRKVLSLQGKSYEWKREEFAAEKFPEGRVTGVIAQEIEKVLPELIATRRDGYKGVAYEEIVPILIEAVKEQQKTIDSQRKEIGEIKVMLQGMKKERPKPDK